MKVIHVSTILLFLLRVNGIHIEQNKLGRETNHSIIDGFIFQPTKKTSFAQRFPRNGIYYYINKKGISEKKEEKEKKKKKNTQFNKVETVNGNNDDGNKKSRNKRSSILSLSWKQNVSLNGSSSKRICNNIDRLGYVGTNRVSYISKHVDVSRTRPLNWKNNNININASINGSSNSRSNSNSISGRVGGKKQRRQSSILRAEKNLINLTDKPLIEKVAKNVKGRLNEWLPEFDDNDTLGFFPILLEEMSNEPAPLQIGFEDYLQFNGENVEEIFKTVTRDVVINNEKKKIFGMCFFNHKTGILAPLAVYAEIKDVTKVGNNLAVKGLVRGRVIIESILKQEPYILAKISEIEDKKGLTDEEQSLKIVDEIMRIHSQCTTMESQLMEQMDQSLASMNIKLRSDLKESVDAKLEKFHIDITNPEQRQAFIQMVSFCAFDFHLMIVDRYDALMLQNSEDRLRFVRDKIRQKQKQLAIIKNTPKEKLQQIMEQVQNLKNNPNLPNLPNMPNMPNMPNNPGGMPKL